MKRLVVAALLAILALAIAPPGARALDVGSSPTKFPIPWGSSAGSAYIRSIPQGSQIGVQNCAASLTDGFPPLTFTPSSAGGCPPFGQDFNGILKQVTQWAQWQAAGGPVFYDSSFSSSIGGYPKGTVLSSTVVPGYRWLSTADNNTTDPDAGGAGWAQDPGQVPTGTPMQTISTTVQTGYVSANGTTIGNASSNATGRANADTQFLFAFVWANCTNAICPIYTSGGGASSRGASAAADYAANKALAVWNMNGSALMGADSQHGTTSTNLSGVPVTSGSRTSPGSVLGENLHVLVAAEIPSIASDNPSAIDLRPANGNLVFNSNGVVITSAAIAGGGIDGVQPGTGRLDVIHAAAHAIAVTSTNTAGGSHNTVPRSTIVYWNLKL